MFVFKHFLHKYDLQMCILCYSVEFAYLLSRVHGKIWLFVNSIKIDILYACSVCAAWSYVSACVVCLILCVLMCRVMKSNLLTVVWLYWHLEWWSSTANCVSKFSIAINWNQTYCLALVNWTCSCFCDRTMANVSHKLIDFKQSNLFSYLMKQWLNFE